MFTLPAGEMGSKQQAECSAGLASLFSLHKLLWCCGLQKFTDLAL